jgi:RimJ/RimL family protein N-acetyltransferase
MLGVGLLPTYRGKGIGRRLMARVIAAAWRKGLTRIELTVRQDNRRAIALYKRLGFKAEGVRRNAFLIDGKYHNLIAMALLKEDR